jgi:23S rRNA A2030 N6-methylase RlmJ
MSIDYDHNNKAGNEGDICKHPALIAALDETIAHAHVPFRYADVFAGYATNLLGGGGEWRRGIGLVAGESLLTGDFHIALWAKWAGLATKPEVGGTYPGSARFAHEICKAREKAVELTLWDTGELPVNSLKAWFSGSARVFSAAAIPDQSEIQEADFVFIDPPSNSHWTGIAKILQQLRSDCSAMIWLPVFADTSQRPPAEDCRSGQIREEALRLGFSVSKIVWAKGGRMIGCQLMYRINPGARIALRKTVDDIVAIARERTGPSAKWASPPVHYDC